MARAIGKRQSELDIDEGVALGLDCGHTWQEVMEEEPPPEVQRLAFLTADEAQRELEGGTGG